MDANLLRTIVAEAAAENAYPQYSPAPSASGNRTTASGSSRSTARPRPLRSPAAQSDTGTDGQRTPTNPPPVPQDVAIMSPSSDMYASEIEDGAPLHRGETSGSVIAQSSHSRARRADRQRSELGMYTDRLCTVHLKIAKLISVIAPVPSSASSSRVSSPRLNPDLPAAVFWKEAPSIVDQEHLQGPFPWGKIQDTLRLEDVVVCQ